MGRKKKKCTVLAKNRGHHSRPARTPVIGFEPSIPDPPIVKRRRNSTNLDTRPPKTRKVTSQISAAVCVLQGAKQTRHKSVMLPHRQKTLLIRWGSFLRESLDSLRHNYEMLKENLFPSSISLSLPFLLPYQLMCIVLLNIRFALHSLFSQNTNLRRQFLRVICTGVDKKLLAPIFGFSQKTFQRALRPLESSSKLILIGTRLPKKKRKSRVNPSVVADARKILDVLAPVKSGKIFRVVSCPLNYLYEQYCALASQISSLKPLSYHYFIGKILDIRNNYVHFENNPDFCPLCRELDEIETIPQEQQSAAQKTADTCPSRAPAGCKDSMGRISQDHEISSDSPNPSPYYPRFQSTAR